MRADLNLGVTPAIHVKGANMLPALGHSTVTANHPSQSAARDTPTPPLYDPPSDLTPGRVSRRKHTLHVDGDIKISRLIDWDATDPLSPRVAQNRLLVETGDNADYVHVRSLPDGRMQISVNGKPYYFDTADHPDFEQTLWIKTNGGDDKVIVDDEIKLALDVEGGDGKDFIQAGAGRTRLYGGRGADTLKLGSGLGYAEGNDGNDKITGGTGNAVMYGNNGRDELDAGSGPATKQSYLDGGNGKDLLKGGSGHSVLHGGNDNDRLVGGDRTTFYTGKGINRILNNKPDDLIYAGANDKFNRKLGSTVTVVKPSSAGEQAFTVLGDRDFRQRVSDDLEFLRSSPIGQQALATLDELALLNGGKIAILPKSAGAQGYQFGSSALGDLPPEDEGDEVDVEEEEGPEDNPAHGTLIDGVPGARADRAKLFFDRHSVLETADRTNTIVPVTTFFHEIAHGYNGATGTFLAGTTEERLASGEVEAVPNEEYQAIGLPSDAEPFDLDNNPSTPPTTVNPKPFTENALNQEMGKPLRKSKNMQFSEQGIGE